jgi:hypothetical protein
MPCGQNNDTQVNREGQKEDEGRIQCGYNANAPSGEKKGIQ